jgi:hypothetical protein
MEAMLHRVQGFLTVAGSIAGGGVAVGEGGRGGGGVDGSDAVSAPSETSPSSCGMAPIRSDRLSARQAVDASVSALQAGRAETGL